MNLHTEYLYMCSVICSQIKEMAERQTRDIFYVVRNREVTYVVIVVGDSE